MKEKERFEKTRKKKKLFSLHTRLTIFMVLNVFLSLMIAFELHNLLTPIIPGFSKIPLITQLLIFCLIVTLVPTRFMSNYVFDPIKQLNEAMQKVADGDFSIRLKTKSTSVEIQEMMTTGQYESLYELGCECRNSFLFFGRLAEGM